MEVENDEKGTNENMVSTVLDFEKFTNVKLIGVALSDFNDEELEILYTQARYCQAMVDADIVTLKEIVPKDVTFKHMSGMVQTRDEYFEDIKRGRLNYYNIGIDNPKININGDSATITYTSVLDANAYGAKGVYRMSGAHHFKKVANEWLSSN